MKKRIAYIGSDCFIEVDSALIPFLVREYDVVWIPVQSKGSPRWPADRIRQFAERFGVTLYLQEIDFRQRSLRNLSFYRNLIKLVRKDGCDLVFTSYKDIFWTLSKALWLREKVVVTGVHDFIAHAGTKFERLETVLSKFAFVAGDHFLFYSSNQTYMFKSAFPKKDACNIGFPLISEGRPSSIRPDIGSGVKLLFFGRIEQYKGLDILIDSLEQVESIKPGRLSLSVYGNGAYADECLKHIRTDELYDLNIHFIDGKDVPDIFNTHHFIVLPYRTATQSGPLSLSLNYNLPVIVPDISSFTHICNHDNSIIYAQGNLTDALLAVADIDHDCYDNLCLKWKDAKNRFAPEIVAARMIDYLNLCLKNEK